MVDSPTEQIKNLNDLLLQAIQKYDNLKDDPNLKKTRGLMHELQHKIVPEPPKKRQKSESKKERKKSQEYGIEVLRQHQKEKYISHYKVFEDKYVSDDVIPQVPSEQPIEPTKNKNPVCNICSKTYSDPHHFYQHLCVTCGNLNYIKRSQTCNLTGKIALVTGGRIKVGYEICLKLLRAGATVIITSRFSHDTLIRYMVQSDFDSFKNRLYIFGIDFIDIKIVEKFIDFLNRSYPKLDILINNACQTIRRPKEFYEHLRQNEIKPIKEINDEFIELLVGDTLKVIQIDTATEKLTGQSLVVCNGMVTDKTITTIDNFSAIEIEKYFPKESYDANHQQIDLRDKNSWIMKADDVPITELAEVHIINSFVPFMFVSKLKNLMTRANDKTFIINVSSMEGKFNRVKKIHHPHTNMMKASLNMLTRTVALDYKSYSIFINSVDTGWITNEYPQKSPDVKFNGYLDEIDGASRCLDPVFMAINHNLYEYGYFYKDYMKSSW